MECSLTHACVSFVMLRNNTCTNIKPEAAEVKWHLLLSLPVLSNAQNMLQKHRVSDCNTTVKLLCGCRFFAGYRVRPDGIHFVMHADGRPSGMAFVEFDCPQEAMRALVRP